MGEINKHIVIEAPVRAVYQFVSDPRNAPKYISSIPRVISGPEGAASAAVGQVWRAEADFLGQKRLINLRVDSLIPNKVVRFVLEGDPQTVVQIHLTPDEAAKSTTVSLSLDATGVPTLLLNALLGGLLGQDMTRLKRRLERET